MAEPHIPDPALLVVAAFSRHDTALAWARERLAETYGPLALTSTPFDFHQTTYYEATMGPGLRKQFFAFRDLVAPELLSDVKLFTNALETALAASGGFAESRPLNLDPGLILLGKFVLATTKDQQHRLYLRDGIFAEVTLRFQDKAFEPWPWTYADYREEAVRAFLKECRDYYRRRLRDRE
jgi:hypothetical protein